MLYIMFSKLDFILIIGSVAFGGSKKMKDGIIGFRDNFVSSGIQLKLPKLPNTCLELELEESELTQDCSIEPLEELKYPLADSACFKGDIISAKILTSQSNLKKKMEIAVKLEVIFECEVAQLFCRIEMFQESIKYLPGDTFGFCVGNFEKEIELFFQLTNIANYRKVHYRLTVSKGKVGKLPLHYPSEGNLYNLVKYCCDLRFIPKKQHLHFLSRFCSNEKHKAALEELSSQGGSKKYNELVFIPHITILDILLVFNSCHVPLVFLLEILPRLNPRPFSVTSSPLISPNILTFVISVVEISFNSCYFEDTRGLCTGWLDQQVALLPDNQKDGDICKQIQSLSLNSQSFQVKLYKRISNGFVLPKLGDHPVIMIAAGTGIAPFIGFLRHWSILGGRTTFPTYLFFGCQHPDHDFLFKSELAQYIEDEVLTEYYTSFSQGEQRLHVQDKVIEHSTLITNTMKNNGLIFVCGSSNMVRDVKTTINHISETAMGLSEGNTTNHVSGWIKDKRYFEDVW